MKINERLGFVTEEEESEQIDYEIPEQDADEILEMTNSTETETESETSNMTTSRRKRDVSEQLSFEDVVLMYDMCRYEKAWYPEKISPWCAAFSKEDLKVTISWNQLKV